MHRRKTGAWMESEATVHPQRSRRRQPKPVPFDLIVLGGGVAGRIVSRDAAARGYRTAVVDPGSPADDWQVPDSLLTKVLLQRSRQFHTIVQHAGTFGVPGHSTGFRWDVLAKQVQSDALAISRRLARADKDVAGIEHIPGTGRFASEREIVAGQRMLPANRFVIATGSHPLASVLPGIDNSTTLRVRDLLRMPELPASAMLAGGSPHAAELAQMLIRFGVRVCMIADQATFLPKEEPLLARTLLDILRGEGVEFVAENRVEAVVPHASGFIIKRDQHAPTSRQVDCILLEGERMPELQDLNLNEAGVQFNDRGISVNAYLATTNPQIWACGDVTGIYPLRQVAEYQAQLVAHNAFAESSPRRADYRVVPWSLLTSPELARVGLTESEARAGGFDTVTGTTMMRDVPRAMLRGTGEGMVKLVVDRETHLILGGHLLADQASEMLAEIALAMQFHLPVEAIASTLHTFPTVSDAVRQTAVQIADRLGAW